MLTDVETSEGLMFAPSVVPTYSSEEWLEH